MAGHVIEREAPVVAPVTTRDVLHRAADLIEEFGWCQGSTGVDDDGVPVGYYDTTAVAFCIGGAFARSWDELAFGEIDGHRIFAKHSLLSPLLGLKPGSEQFWNDAPGRTKAEVVARLRQAAEAAA